MVAVLFLSTLVYCGLLSWLASRRFPPLLTRLGTVLGVAGFVALAGATIGRHPAYVFPMMICPFLLLPFLTRALEVWLHAAGRITLGVDRMKPVRTYDLAEKAVHDQNIDEAIRLYREVYAPRDPNDPVPHFRVAELLLRQGRRGEAAVEFQTAARLFEDPQNALIAAFRAADLMADPKPWLQSLRPRFSGKFLEMLEARIRS